MANHSTEKKKLGRKEDLCYDSRFGSEEETIRECVPKDAADRSNFSFSHFLKKREFGLLIFYLFIFFKTFIIKFMKKNRRKYLIKM